jgi:hypothetical protein
VESPERRLNRRQQGDLGEASAIEWLTSVGAAVFLPLGHSPDYDVVAEARGLLLKIQVKTSTQVTTTPRGYQRSVVALATRGGNQSWNGTVKTLDPARVDYLFALTEDGRRWFIPCSLLAGRKSIALGGPSYSEFEIEPGRPIGELVYAVDPTLESESRSGEYPRGQRTAAVNRLAQPSQVRLLPPPFRPRPGFPASKYDRKAGRIGEAVLNQKRRVTLPRHACNEAGLQDGDRVRVRSDGDGRLLIERLEPPPRPGAV